VIKSFIIKVASQALLSESENDIHYATLTVKQTLAFALKARTPKELPEQMSRSQYRNSFLDILLTIFGIKHTVNTRVGNEVPSLCTSTYVVYPWYFWWREKESVDCGDNGHARSCWVLG